MVRVRLLGVPALLAADGQELRLRSKKQLGVLVYLVLDGRERPVSRDALMDAFWSGAPRERAYHSLCQAVSELRSRLGREAVVNRGDGLQLMAPVQTDIEALADGDDRGDFTRPLRDVEWWGGVDVEHWVERSRERCRRMAEQVLRDGIAAHRRGGATLRAHRCAALLYELDPLSEPAVLVLAERELLQGDVVGAIRLLRAHRTRVAETLGCQPQAAPERLLRRLEAGAHPPVELVPKRLAAHAARVRPTVLVARERELSHLEAEWQRVHDSRAFRSCIITGPGGIGKSSLIRRFAATVAARAQTAIVVSCQEMGEGIPFAALADFVAALLRDPAVSGTEPLWLAEVSRIQPAVRAQYPGVPAPMESPPETVRVRIAEGVSRMIAAVTDGAPLALLFDDLQHMDPATRDVLAVLCRRAQQLPLFLVGTARSLGLESGLPSGPLGRETMPWTSALRLNPLTAEGIRSLLSVLAPSLQLDTPQVARRIVELSEGNPHFTEMLIADWQQYATASLAAGRAADQLPANWQPPESLRHAFAKLYEGLDDSTQQLLHMLAVAQRALTPEEVAVAIGVSTTLLDHIALELLTRGILRLDEGALCFKSELHRAYVYFALPEQALRYHHRKFGRFLLDSVTTTYANPKIEAARHFTHAGDRRSARSLILSFAAESVDSGACVETEQVIRQYLSESPPDEQNHTVRLLLAQSLTTQGRYLDALSELASLDGTHLELLDQARLGTLRAQCLHRSRLADEQRVLAECREALDLATQADSESLIAVASQVTIEAASEASDDSLIKETITRVRRLSSEAGDSNTRARTIGTEAFCLMEAGDFGSALGVFETATAAFRGAKLDSELARSLNGHGICAMATGRHELALESFKEAVEVAERLQDADYRITLLGNMGLASEERGDFDEAWTRYLQAVELAQEGSSPRRSALAHANAAHMAVVLGDTDRSAKFIALGRDSARESRLAQLVALVDFTEADRHLAMQEPELAWQLVPRALRARGRRVRAMDNNGKATRLTLHWLLATKGAAALTEQYQGITARLPEFRLSDRLEIAAFLAWFDEAHGRDDERPDDLVREIERSRLWGVLGILRAVGTCPRCAQAQLRQLVS